MANDTIDPPSRRRGRANTPQATPGPEPRPLGGRESTPHCAIQTQGI